MVEEALHALDLLFNQWMQSHAHITPLLHNQLDSFAWLIVISSQSYVNIVVQVLSDIPHSPSAPHFNIAPIVLRVVSAMQMLQRPSPV